MKINELEQDLARLRQLAGITLGSGGQGQGQVGEQDSVLTHAGTERAQYARQHNIKPGTDEWFRLWFARQPLTGEDPMPKKNSQSR